MPAEGELVNGFVNGIKAKHGGEECARTVVDNM